jgi:hypothetical protein
LNFEIILKKRVFKHAVMLYKGTATACTLALSAEAVFAVNGTETQRVPQAGLKKGGLKARPMIKAFPGSAYARPMLCSNSFRRY